MYCNVHVMKYKGNLTYDQYDSKYMEVTAGKTICRKTLFKIYLKFERHLTKLLGIETKMKLDII